MGWLYFYGNFLPFNLSAYLSVFNEWLEELLPGQIQANITTLLLYFLLTNESLKDNVNFEALNGICVFPWFIALIHSFNASNDLLMLAPSILLYLLFDFVSYALSEPARSTTINLPISTFLSLLNIDIKHIACDLEDVSLLAVEWVVLLSNAN